MSYARDVGTTSRSSFLAGLAAAAFAAEGTRAFAAEPERHIALAGAPNFRDLGGYATTAGRRVRPRLVFRSGELSRLTEADYARLAPLDLRVVCDFRTAAERRRDPTRWRGSPVPRFELLSIGEGTNRLPTSESEAHAFIERFYRDVPLRYADRYAAVFDTLVAGGSPLVMHCSAGKDRTGIASALLLTALGVSHSTVVADYALTNRYLGSAATHARLARSAALHGISPSALSVLFAAAPAYIETSFTSIRAEYGDFETYRRRALRVNDAALARLRARLLT